MATIKDLHNKYNLKDIEIPTKAKASVPTGADGQLAPVSDVAGVNLLVRKDGVLVPPIDMILGNTVQEALTFAVDYATGTSPPDGTLVKTQAEATALGTLKYVQDVIDVLPTYSRFSVTVNVAAGVHYAKPNSAGSGLTTMLRLKGFIAVNGALDAIKIQGAVTQLETGIAGTLTAYAFTRTAGTWTAGELAGKYMNITAGASSGRIIAIRDNTEDTIYFAGYVNATGAATVTTQEPATTLLANTDGGTHSYGIIPGEGTEFALWISDCILGSASSRLKYSYIRSGRLVLFRCVLNGSLGLYGIANAAFYDSIFRGASDDPSGVLYINSSIPTVLTSGLATTTKSGSNVISVVKANAVINSFEVVLLSGATGSRCIDLSYDAWLRILSQGQTHETLLDGGGIGDGINIEGHAQITGGTLAKLVNCVNAIKAVRGSLESSQIGSASCADNEFGYVISDNSNIRISSIVDLNAITYGTVDGTEVFSTDFAADGDTVIGPSGSLLSR